MAVQNFTKFKVIKVGEVAMQLMIPVIKMGSVVFEIGQPKKIKTVRILMRLGIVNACRKITSKSGVVGEKTEDEEMPEF